MQTLYLSQLSLNLQSRLVRQDFENLYDMHRTLSQAVSAGLDKKAERLLWRIEQTPKNQAPLLLVQSHSEPNWQVLSERDANYLHTVQSKSFSPNLVVGQQLNFRLKANPTIKRKGKRWGIPDSAGQIQWLMRKAQNHGFALQECHIRQQQRIRPYKGKREQIITLDTVTFEGKLIVSDIELFNQALRLGIGSAKSLGMGLLSVAATPPVIS